MATTRAATWPRIRGHADAVLPPHPLISQSGSRTNQNQRRRALVASMPFRRPLLNTESRRQRLHRSAEIALDISLAHGKAQTTAVSGHPELSMGAEHHEARSGNLRSHGCAAVRRCGYRGTLLRFGKVEIYGVYRLHIRNTSKQWLLECLRHALIKIFMQREEKGRRQVVGLTSYATIRLAYV